MNVDDVEFDFKMTEDPKYLIFDYKHGIDNFRMVYYKHRDLAAIMKNGTKADLKKLNESERKRYKSLLEIAICYHHDKEGSETH